MWGVSRSLYEMQMMVHSSLMSTPPLPLPIMVGLPIPSPTARGGGGGGTGMLHPALFPAPQPEHTEPHSPEQEIFLKQFPLHLY